MRDANTPVTVVMAVHNGSQYIRTAIDSLLAQTYLDFRLLIVDDASTDDTRDIVRTYADPRIELVCLERNIGQTAALNVGLQRASTPWIARMDADDYAAPRRLEEQMQLAESDASLGCIGTFAWIFRDDPQHRDEIVEKPLEDTAIRRRFWHAIPLIHGSLIMRRHLVLEAGGYDARYRYSADWDLYHRLLTRCRAANVPIPLLGIRRHPGQHSFLKATLDENIAIFSRVLAAEHCTRRDRAMVRNSLAFTYVHRARRDRLEGQFKEMFHDVSCAFQWAPVTAAKHLLVSAARTPRHAAL